MALPHTQPGEVVDVRPLGSALVSSQTATLLRAEQVEVRRLMVPAGKEIAEHKAKGEIIVHCLGRCTTWDAGRVEDSSAVSEPLRLISVESSKQP